MSERTIRNLFLLSIFVIGCASGTSYISPEFFVYDGAGVVVWVSPCFHETIYVPAGQGCSNPSYMQLTQTGLGALLQSGRLDPARLYAAFPGASPPPKPGRRRLPAGQWLDALREYEGPLVKVLNVTETASDDGHAVVIRLEATTSSLEDGWGSVDFVDIIVSNPDVSVLTERQAYFATARVDDVRYSGTML